MKIAAEFSAALPEPCVILGVRLLPLSLGRYRLLKRFDCPFVDESERKVDIDELVKELFFAILICGLTVDEFGKLICNPKSLAKEAKRLGKSAKRLISKTDGFSIYEAFDQFKKYLKEGSEMPWHVISKSGESSESASHWSHSMEVALRSKIGWTKEEIDEQPMSKAMTDFFKYMESEGSVTLMTHDDRQYLEEVGEANGRILAALQNEMRN